MCAICGSDSLLLASGIIMSYKLKPSIELKPSILLSAVYFTNPQPSSKVSNWPPSDDYFLRSVAWSLVVPFAG